MEEIAIRLVRDGESHTGIIIGPWPLPDTVLVQMEDGEPDGFYHKVSESGLPPMDPDSHVIRGATFEWAPA